MINIQNLMIYKMVNIYFVNFEAKLLTEGSYGDCLQNMFYTVQAGHRGRLRIS